jgi:hypothetical protein
VDFLCGDFFTDIEYKYMIRQWEQEAQQKALWRLTLERPALTAGRYLYKAVFDCAAGALRGHLNDNILASAYKGPEPAFLVSLLRGKTEAEYKSLFADEVAHWRQDAE